MSRRASVERKTKETQIIIGVDLDRAPQGRITTGLPFFDHMLAAMAFHGGFDLSVNGTGDLDVDPHHLVEDCGIVLGRCLETVFREGGSIRRFGHAVIPMDEALAEATIDVCGRPTLIYRAALPQSHAGSFPLWLLREFFAGLSMGAQCALHLECRYGENAHHMAEALFKALGKAMGAAYASADDEMSTKGTI